jgi:hypothetical protein
MLDNTLKDYIIVKNMSFVINCDERDKIASELNEYNIGIEFIETRGIENSIFDTFSIYINVHLTELIITGLLAPAAYDVIKNSVILIVKSICRFAFRRKKDEPEVCIKFKTDKAEIIAPVPENLNDTQFACYMDMLGNSIRELSQSQIYNIKRFDYYIIEFDNETNGTVIKTSTEYGMERVRKQKEKAL